jgi:hypothetical protein
MMKWVRGCLIHGGYWRALVNTGMNLLFRQKNGEFVDC